MKDNIYLCGFMGCGKSTVGRVLAQQLHCPFIDLDDLIVAKMGMRIPDIFQQKGESFFRNLEQFLLQDVSPSPCATTGSTMTPTAPSHSPAPAGSFYVYTGSGTSGTTTMRIW